MGESQPPSRNVAITTPAISPVEPPGECDVLNHDQLGWVMPAACELSSLVRPQIASVPMIRYSPRITQPSNRIVTFTPMTAIATTSRQMIVATTQVSGLLLVSPGAIRLSTVDPISVMLPMFEVSAVIRIRMPTAKPMIGDRPLAIQATGASADACHLFSRWYATEQHSIAAPATSSASGDPSPAAPIRAAIVSVVAAVGATLVMEAIQSPRRPTDFSASPVEDASLLAGLGSVLIAAEPLFAGTFPGRRGHLGGGSGAQDGGPEDRPRWGADRQRRPAGGVGDRPGAAGGGHKGVFRLAAAHGRIPGEGRTGLHGQCRLGGAGHDIKLAGEVADRGALHGLGPLVGHAQAGGGGRARLQGLLPGAARAGRVDHGGLDP